MTSSFDALLVLFIISAVHSKSNHSKVELHAKIFLMLVRQFRSMKVLMFLVVVSSGSTVANVSTGYNAGYVLESPDGSTAINQYILLTSLPRLYNASLTVNGTTGYVNITYLSTQTAAEVNDTS
jgi:hypothetical protein